jgi:integrase
MTLYTRYPQSDDPKHLVFKSGFGTPISRADLITRSFKPLLNRAGLLDIRFRDLRHTCATLLLGRGVHTKLVRELFSHSSVTVILDTYSHVLPSWTTDSPTRWMRR